MAIIFTAPFAVPPVVILPTPADSAPVEESQEEKKSEKSDNEK